MVDGSHYQGELTFLLRFAICSLMIGKYETILPIGSMIVARYGASYSSPCRVGARVREKRRYKRTSSLLMPLSRSSTERLYAWAAIALSDALSEAP